MAYGAFETTYSAADGPVREHSLSARRKVGAGPACVLLRPVAEVRHRLSLRDPARDHPARLRSRHHPLRQRRPLRPAASRRAAELRQGASKDLAPYRDEIILSTKAGNPIGPSPYLKGGSRKSLLTRSSTACATSAPTTSTSSTSHRPDPTTPLEETVGALVSAVQQGKALYVGISNYPPSGRTRSRCCCAEAGVPLLVHQPRYSDLRPQPRAERPARAGRRRGRLRAGRLFAAGTRAVDRQVPGRPSRTGARAAEQHVPLARRHHETTASGRRPQQARRGARPVTGAARAAVGAAEPEVTSALIGASSTCAARPQRQGARLPAAHRRRAEAHRRARRARHRVAPLT